MKDPPAACKGDLKMKEREIGRVEMDEGGEIIMTKARKRNELQDGDATTTATTTGEGVARKKCWSLDCDADEILRGKG